MQGRKCKPAIARKFSGGKNFWRNWQAAEGRNDIEREKAIRSIAQNEKRNREFKKLRRVLKPRWGGVLPGVDIPRGMKSVDEMWECLKERREEPEDWETVTGKDEVESLVIQWCRRHFGQAAETPLAIREWDRILDVTHKESQVQ